MLQAGNGWLRSQHHYKDFHLHVEWKALQAEGYDAGIYLRAQQEGAPFPAEGYQVNLLQGREGHISNLPGAETSGLIKPAGEWNSFDIRVIGDRVRLAINGKPAYEVGGMEISNGYIGLQVEVPKGGQFYLKNIQVTELGYTSLFNGSDFSGWEGADGAADLSWQANEGVLYGLPNRGPWLRSLKEYDDFNLRLEYQVAKGGNSGVYIRVPSNGAHRRRPGRRGPFGIEVQILDDTDERYVTLKDYQFTGSLYAIVGPSRHVAGPPGAWNSLEINCAGERITTVHNGVVVVDATPEEFPLLLLPRKKGYLGLQNHGEGANFRNLRIGPPLEMDSANTKK